MPPYDVEDQCALLRGSLCLRPAGLAGILSLISRCGRIRTFAQGLGDVSIHESILLQLPRFIKTVYFSLIIASTTSPRIDILMLLIK